MNTIDPRDHADLVAENACLRGELEQHRRAIATALGALDTTPWDDLAPRIDALITEARDVAAHNHALRAELAQHPDHLDRAAQATVDDATFYSALLDRVGFVDGAEVTADGSAHNDLAHERAQEVLAFISEAAHSAWPEELRRTATHPADLPAPRPARRVQTHQRNHVATRVNGLAGALVDLGRLALRFGQIDRTAVYHPDGVTPESDTDHTVMLGWIACALAARCFPTLDQGLVAQYALVHDAPEVYAGDTPTLRITPAGRAAKAAREHAALQRLHAEFTDRLPWFPAVLTDYEAQHAPEARYVRAVDKILPKIVHLLDGATGLLEQGMRSRELADVFTRQRADIAGYAAEFTELLHLHAELADRVIQHPALAAQGEVA